MRLYLKAKAYSCGSGFFVEVDACTFDGKKMGKSGVAPFVSKLRTGKGVFLAYGFYNASNTDERGVETCGYEEDVCVDGCVFEEGVGKAFNSNGSCSVAKTVVERGDKLGAFSKRKLGLVHINGIRANTHIHVSVIDGAEEGRCGENRKEKSLHSSLC